MDLLKLLEEDHKRIIQKINRLPGSLLKARQNLDALLNLSEDLEKELSRHEKIEDLVFFPALRGKVSEQSLQSLIDEHVESKKIRDLFMTAIAEIKSLGDHSPPEKIKEMSGHGYKLMRILSTHFTREDQLLFPIAKSILTKDQSEDLWKQTLAYL